METGKKTVKRPSKRGTAVKRKLKPLKAAADRIADMLCGLSEETSLFVFDPEEGQGRKLDTKTLKEFSAVIKEMSGVICELNGIGSEENSKEDEGVYIEFSDEAEAYGK